MKQVRLVACALVFQAAWPCVSTANMLNGGNFNSPDNIPWTDSGWSTWTSASRSGRETWAERQGVGRGGVAYGWNAASEMGIYQDVPATTGATYALRVWVKKEINYNEATTQLTLEWRDAGHVDLGSAAVSNITGLSTSNFAEFVVSGMSTNPNLRYVRAVIYTRWNTPTNGSTAAMMFDDASLGFSVFRPKIGAPAFAEPNGTLVAEIINAPAGLASNQWSATLTNDLRAWTNCVVEEAEYGTNVYNNSIAGYRLTIRVPNDIPPELFSLSVNHPGAGGAMSAHSVKIVPSLETNFYILHYADPQVVNTNATAASGQNSGYGSVQAIEWSVTAFNLVNPRFMVNTGDESMDGAQAQYVPYLAAISRFNFPLLITRGNHDSGGFDTWKSQIGPARYSVDIGSFKVWMNDVRSAEGWTWFTNDYACSFTNASVRYRLVAQHFHNSGAGPNYFLPAAGQYPGLMLLGHAHSFYTWQLSPYPILVSGPAFDYGKASIFEFARTPDSWVCTNLASHAVNNIIQPYGNWGIPKMVTNTFAAANDGSQYANTANITNSLSYDFWDGRMRFLLRKARGGYAIGGGEKLAEYDYANGSNTAVLVKVDIRPNCLTTVSVFRIDGDDDGMPDTWEMAMFGDLATASADSDFDDDDFLDWEECAAGTHPTNSDSRLMIMDTRPVSEGIRVEWKGGTDVWQYLQFTENLMSTSETWRTIVTNPPPMGTTNIFIFGEETNRGVFLRIQVSRP